ncbi:MAG: phosphotransferase [Saccharofermentanales bacterium]
MNKEYKLQFDKLCIKLKLGQLTSEPEQIFGGHLNRMYAMSTTTGKYAVKALNPQVMLRPEAKQNHLNAEHIAQIAAKVIPAAPAKIFDGNFMIEIDGQYYLVFDWLDGKSIFYNEITINECHKMGNILAKLHSVDFSELNLVDTCYSAEKLTDWNDYLQKGIKANVPWVDLVSKNIANLTEWNYRIINASKKLSEEIVISHGDLEPKNVMWKDDNPVIIDWEGAGFIHPMHDLVETALYWSVNADGSHDKDKFLAFVYGYKNVQGEITADWPVVLDKGFSLGWLEYSLKRSLGIEAADEEERQMGSEHVVGSIHMLHEYDRMKERIIDWMGEKREDLKC